MQKLAYCDEVVTDKTGTLTVNKMSVVSVYQAESFIEVLDCEQSLKS